MSGEVGTWCRRSLDANEVGEGAEGSANGV